MGGKEEDKSRRSSILARTGRTRVSGPRMSHQEKGPKNRDREGERERAQTNTKKKKGRRKRRKREGEMLCFVLESVCSHLIPHPPGPCACSLCCLSYVSS